MKQTLILNNSDKTSLYAKGMIMERVYQIVKQYEMTLLSGATISTFILNIKKRKKNEKNY